MAWVGWMALAWPACVLILLLLGNAPRATTGGIRRMLQPTDVKGMLLSKYLSNTELESHLNDYVQRCSKIANLVKWGKSAGGADLLALHISSQPQLNGDVAKPQFKYVGNVHGDEPSGRQLLLVLAERLCAGYPKDSGVKQLVDNVELFIIPSMNPDGFAIHRRENKASVDLNRNFPDPVRLKGKDLRHPVGPEQPETLAMMNFTLTHRFVASLALHEGALVANYPFDGYPDGDMNVRGEKHTAPDDAGFVALAQLYAKKHTTMAGSREFKGGITNGAQWYPLYGGMQDWNYLAADCMEVTLELNDQKWPEPPRLAAMWGENERALLEYPLATLSGVHGVVTGEGPDGKDLPLAATITVEGINHNSTSSPRFGDYYKILAPGTYKLTVMAPTFKTTTVPVTVPSGGAGVRLNLRLEPLVRYPKKPPPAAVPGAVLGEADEDQPQKAWILVHGGPGHSGKSSSGVSSFAKIGAIVMVQVFAVGAFMLWRRYAKDQEYTQLLSPSASPLRSLGLAGNRVSRIPV